MYDYIDLRTTDSLELLFLFPPGKLLGQRHCLGWLRSSQRLLFLLFSLSMLRVIRHALTTASKKSVWSFGVGNALRLLSICLWGALAACPLMEEVRRGEGFGHGMVRILRLSQCSTQRVNGV